MQPILANSEAGSRERRIDIPVDSDSWGGQNVFDVYTKSEGIGLDGTKYKDW
jgi:general secretion pathway protein G